MLRELTRLPLNVLGQAVERNLQFEMPSLPRVYDGAALYWLVVSSTTTPTSASTAAKRDSTTANE